MRESILALGLDVLVLVFLGVMIFYCLRLSNSLNAFRAHREAFDRVIRDLLSSMDQAEKSIQNLKEVSRREAEDLNELISISKSLARELREVNEAGENMAKRLEMLAERNRKIVAGDGGGFEMPEDDMYEGGRISSSVTVEQPGAQVTAKSRRGKSEAEIPSFMIRDPDYEPLGVLEDRLETSASNDVFYDEFDDEDVPGSLQSQAEKELFQALRSSRKKLGGG